MSDMTCLAENYVVPADFEKTGVNLNEIVVGPTGCGKSFSTAYPRLLHTFESSVVVPIAKGAIKDNFAQMFIDRGYEVIDLNFANPGECTVGYDPMDYIKSNEDVIQTARNFIGGLSKNRNGDADPYWNDSATSVLAAVIALVRIRAERKKKKPTFAEVVKTYRGMKIDYERGDVRTSLDSEFVVLEHTMPGNQASELWKTVKNLSSRTASCIFSIVNSSLDKIFTKDIIEMTGKRRGVSFRRLGERKTALFITTSPMNLTLQNYVNVMYSDMFRELFETAESRENYRLKVPVHIICDDFACGSRISNFENYISIFRAAGISSTLLLQSESQLTDMYGDTAATTIINNCDTYVYMGGMDIPTCNHIAQRLNKPLHRVMSMPLEQVVVFRRGMEPVVSRRYQLLDDPLYANLQEQKKTNCTKPDERASA